MLHWPWSLQSAVNREWLLITVNLDWITATKLQPSLQGMGSLTWSSTLLWILVVFHVGDYRASWVISPNTSQVCQTCDGQLIWAWWGETCNTKCDVVRLEEVRTQAVCGNTIFCLHSLLASSLNWFISHLFFLLRAWRIHLPTNQVSSLGTALSLAWFSH